LEPPWWRTIVVEEKLRTRTVTLPSDYFAVGKSELPPDLQAQIDSIAARIKQEAVGPATASGGTDGTGSLEANDTLGFMRAESLVVALKRAGLTEGSGPGQLLPAQSLGERAPVCPELDAAGDVLPDCQARNRRVVITYSIKEIVK
jgi:outer membrane protein OmpA-like peptidoglycan-associated protein